MKLKKKQKLKLEPTAFAPPQPQGAPRATPRTQAPNPNCVSRGKCIQVGPGTKYPEQNTVCLGDAGGAAAAWHCVNTGGRWGTEDHTSVPGLSY